MNRADIKKALRLLVGLMLLGGCAGQRSRVVVTRLNGEPAVSFEFEPTEK